MTLETRTCLNCGSGWKCSTSSPNCCCSNRCEGEYSVYRARRLAPEAHQEQEEIEIDAEIRRVRRENYGNNAS